MEVETHICLKCKNLQTTLVTKENEIMKLKHHIEALTKYIQENCKCNISLLNFLNGEKSEEVHESSATSKTSSDIYFMNNDILDCDEIGITKKSLQMQHSGSLDTNNFNGTKGMENEVVSSKTESQHDYIFDENYQMYYSSSTGYYYDSNKGLLYEPQSGIYYKYDYEKKEYFSIQLEESVNSICEAVAEKVNDLNLNDDLAKSESHFDEVFKTEVSSPTHMSEIHNATSCAVFDKDDISHGSAKDWQPEEGSNMTVTDMVKQVVDEQNNMSDYIYDESYQMYYSPSTGYYYDAVRKLLYDPSSGIYYFYDDKSQTYEFYCQTNLTDESKPTGNQYCINMEKLKNRKMYWKRKLNESKQAVENEEASHNEEVHENSEEEFSSPEDGEIFSSDDESDQPVCITRPPIKGSQPKSPDDLCPPSIRAIVESSEDLKIGSLILITYSGGIVGRDQTNAIFLPDLCISKMHAEIKYNCENQNYSIEDLGSQNGTFVNNQRLSESKEKSEPCILNHGDRISFGSCRLLIHIHENLETCDSCEPGQVLAEISSQTEKNIVIMSKEEKEKSRREEVRRLKKKYGLQSADFVVKTSMISDEYEDKAEMRRQLVGSDNPYEKTEETSSEVSMLETNKGYQMLKKMGWKEGETLGTTNSGLLEPIPVRAWSTKAGLGSCHGPPSTENNPENRKKKKWVKAQERFFQLTLKDSS